MAYVMSCTHPDCSYIANDEGKFKLHWIQHGRFYCHYPGCFCHFSSKVERCRHVAAKHEGRRYGCMCGSIWARASSFYKHRGDCARAAEGMLTINDPSISSEDIIAAFPPVDASGAGLCNRHLPGVTVGAKR